MFTILTVAVLVLVLAALLFGVGYLMSQGDILSVLIAMDLSKLAVQVLGAIVQAIVESGK